MRDAVLNIFSWKLNILKIIYISPSEFPSQAANYVHVVLQSEALSSINKKVTLVGMRSKKSLSSKQAERETIETFDLESKDLEFKLCGFNLPFAKNFLIALYSLGILLKQPASAIISRNLYACFFVLIFTRRRMLYETHTVEKGVRGVLQRFLLCSDRVTIIVITHALRDMIAQKAENILRRTFVCPDAAKAGLPLIARGVNTGNYPLVFGYFGSLLNGRGVEVIVEMARELDDCLFLIFGPTQQNKDFVGRVSGAHNIRVNGYLPHKKVHAAMSGCDVLLMPYQHEVSIGLRGSDTSKIMSPMKMFEYMATGRAIISSNLPVLREVLRHEENCLLAEPHRTDSWIDLANRLRDERLRLELGGVARREYEQLYNWNARAAKLTRLL